MTMVFSPFNEDFVFIQFSLVYIFIYIYSLNIILFSPLSNPPYNPPLGKEGFWENGGFAILTNIEI